MQDYPDMECRAGLGWKGGCSGLQYITVLQSTVQYSTVLYCTVGGHFVDIYGHLSDKYGQLVVRGVS